MPDIGIDFQSGNLNPEFIEAPDGSEIRLLHELHMGGMSECTLPPNSVSVAVEHKTVEEIWLCTAGKGEIWRSQNGVEEILNMIRTTNMEKGYLQIYSTITIIFSK